jgi:hypothetical protein
MFPATVIGAFLGCNVDPAFESRMRFTATTG